jgi:tetratricopeptide (TPR) repeat protein
MPILERVHGECPNQRSILFAMALCAWRLGEIERARKLFDEVREYGSVDRELALALAEFELEQLHLEGAEAALVLAKDMTADQWRSDDRWWWLQAKMMQQRRMLPAALEAVSEAYELYPRSLPYLQARISLLRLLGRMEEARRLEGEADARRDADRRLYVIMQSSELNQPMPQLMREIAQLCRVQRKTLQAEGWQRLADQVQLRFRRN